MDFDVWAQRGNRGWSYDDILPYFCRFETYKSGGDLAYRGQSGEMTITDLDWRDPLCEAYIDGANSLGIPRNPDYNGKAQEGISYLQRTVNGRTRMSAAKAFLNPAKKRPNLRVITNAHVTRLTLSGKQVTGVSYQKGGVRGKHMHLMAEKEVIISGGAINTPQLLQLSGIGPASLLQQLGIDVQHDLPGVGENLRDHYATRLTASVEGVQTINDRAHGIKLVGEVAKYCIGQQSILKLGPTTVFCFWRSKPGLTNPDVQINFTPGTHQRGMQSTLEKKSGFTLATWQHRPESSGYVRSVTNNPFDKPEIQPNYLSDEEDQRVILDAAKLCRRLMQTDALKPFHVKETYPGTSIQNDNELLHSIRDMGQSIYHLMGTCRMGPINDPMAVVDDQLKVHGMDNLRVIDASIMPTMISANLNAGVLMIAEKGADLVLGKTPLTMSDLQNHIA